MAKGEVFLTNVKHGVDDTYVWVEAGTPVDKADLPSDVIDDLREAGAVGYPQTVESAVDTIQAQADRIAQLEAALAEANGTPVQPEQQPEQPEPPAQ